MMAKQGGSLPRGRRLPDELPDVPPSADLTSPERSAQALLRSLVESAGGRQGSTSIPLGYISELADLLDSWARGYASSRPDGLYFNGRPGLWHALDRLYPLEDPNRWDALRKEVILELEHRGWRRARPPRGSGFHLPE
jgi:hypothetical protein